VFPRLTAGTFTLTDGKGRLLGVIPARVPRESVVFSHDRLNGRLEQRRGVHRRRADCPGGLVIQASDPDDLVWG
jgi:hypothetical protein